MAQLDLYNILRKSVLFLCWSLSTWTRTGNEVTEYVHRNLAHGPFSILIYATKLSVSTHSKQKTQRNNIRTVNKPPESQ